MDTPTDQLDPQRRHWAPCEPGQLQQMAAQVRSDRRHKALSRAALVVALLATVGLGAYYGWNSLSNTPQAIYCKAVREHVGGYAAGELDAELKVRIDYHLAHCHSCRSHYRKFGLVSQAMRPAFPLAALLLDALQTH